MNAAVIEKLATAGCPIQEGGLNGSLIVHGFFTMPLIALHESSEEPTVEEIEEIKEIREYITTKFGCAPDAVSALGANTVAIRKVNGCWAYRRLTWDVGPMWSPNTRTLSDVRSALY